MIFRTQGAARKAKARCCRALESTRYEYAPASPRGCNIWCNRNSSRRAAQRGDDIAREASQRAAESIPCSLSR